jgi:hypothetical protein
MGRAGASPATKCQSQSNSVDGPKEWGKGFIRKDDPPRGSLGGPNHQEDVVNVRLPFRIAAVAGLLVSSLGIAQGPSSLPVRQAGAQAPETLAPPTGLGGPVATSMIDPMPLGGPGGPGAGMAMNPPAMPPNAWPTYAPYNNYSRVAYPNEYPYAAFPYIGPMYPFPKVPLGYRAIKLEWEDGHWWYGRTATRRDYWTVRYW